MNLTDEYFSRLESIANFMRGMTLDPAIPDHTKAALRSKIDEIDAFVDEHMDD